MNVNILPSFLKDLREADDHKLVRRVLDQVIESNGVFKRDANDHRYHGVENAWIRYVSGGKTAYRLIYIQVNNLVYLYRVGQHSIEDRLTPPREFAGYTLAKGEVAVAARPAVATGSGTLLKTSQTVMLSKVLASMYHVEHREIWLVSPYLSTAVLERRAPLGNFLDRAMEEGTAIGLITKFSEQHGLAFYDDLEARGICVYFHPRLHAKLYLFELEKASLTKFNRDAISTAILGSANLTSAGLSLFEPSGNEELCYRVPESQFHEAKEYAAWLANQSQDLQSLKIKLSRRF